MRIQAPMLAFLFAMAGAISFWLPDVVTHFAVRDFDVPQVRLVTLLMPLSFLCIYLLARKFGRARDFQWLGGVMLVGVWFTGGVFMSIAATPSGGGFGGPNGMKGGLLMATLGALPPVTLMMSVYDGAGLALLIVTLGTLVTWFVQSRGRTLPFRHSSR